MKSYDAAELSARILIGESAKVYLWTFTFKRVIPIKEASRRWNILRQNLVRQMGVKGLRVFELHPGGHGLHVHMIVCERISVELVRGYALGAGFGRIHVKAISSKYADYVVKYVGKQKREGCLKGVRLWQTVGFKGTRVKDVVTDNAIKRQMKELIPFIEAACAVNGWDSSRRAVTYRALRAAERMFWSCEKEVKEYVKAGGKLWRECADKADDYVGCQQLEIFENDSEERKDVLAGGGRAADRSCEAALSLGKYFFNAALKGANGATAE